MTDQLDTQKARSAYPQMRYRRYRGCPSFLLYIYEDERLFEDLRVPHERDALSTIYVSNDITL
jgi:hypothetical protein